MGFFKSLGKAAALPVQAVVAPKAAVRTVKENWVPIRDTAETAAVLAGNYFLPGSSVLTGKLTSQGSQKQLNSDLGLLAQIGTGVGGYSAGNLSNYGSLMNSVGLGGVGSSMGIPGSVAGGGTAGDMAAMYKAAYPSLTNAEAMMAAESAMASGMTPSMLSSSISGMGGGLFSGLSGISGLSGLTGLSGSAGSSGLSGLLSTGLNLAGGYLQGESNKQAAQDQAAAQIQAAQIAAEAAKFRPVGVTTRFGKSKFEYDPSGRLTGAGYIISPELKAQQDALMGMSGNALQQYQAAQGLTAPMLSGAQRAMQLGQGYLASTPQEQAAKYMAEQQALFAPSRAEQMSTLQNRLAQQGRLGVATGGGVGGMLPTSPEMAAYYNALRQQDLELASRATQAGQEYAKFGTGMLGAGGDLMSSAYGAQTSAFSPYQTALGGATRLEDLGMQPMFLGSELGSTATAAAAAGGRAQAQGISDAARYQAQSTAMNPWANLFGGLGSAAQQYRWGQ